jgi:hypothetical protein
MPSRFYEFIVLPDFGGSPYGRIVVSIPPDQILELKRRFPGHEIRGEDREIQIAIQGGLTDAEKGKILSELDLCLTTPIRFQILTVPAADLHPSKPPNFESSGKSFWVQR